MNTKKKIIIGLSSIASIGALIYGYHKFKQFQYKEKILVTLQLQRFFLSQKLVKIVEIYNYAFKNEQDKGITQEQISQGILNNQELRNSLLEARVFALKRTEISEQEYNTAINETYKNDEEVQKFVMQLKNAVHLASKGVKNYFQLTDYPKFTLKECIKHHLKMGMLAYQLPKQESLNKLFINYSKQEGFNVIGYHPLYITYINNAENEKEMEPVVKLISEIVVTHAKQKEKDPNYQFDEGKSLELIYKELNIQD